MILRRASSGIAGMMALRHLAALLVALVPAAPAIAATAITIGVAPVVPTASTYLALDNGWFAAAGFDVKIEELDSATKLIPFLANGQMQVVLPYFRTRKVAVMSFRSVADMEALKAQAGK